MVTALDTGREAIGRHDWVGAQRAFTDADLRGEMTPDDMLMLADAYWWTGQPDDAIETYERAFNDFVADGRKTEAASTGALLAYFAIRRRTPSVAGAWVGRAEQLLEGEPPSPGHAWLALLRVAFALFVKVDLDRAIVEADKAIEMAKELKLPAMEGLGTSFKGIVLIQLGDWQRGLALIDEATVMAMTEGRDLRAASDVYCNTIAACANLGDYQRAGEWTDEAERWMHANSVAGYTGICKVHRAELKRMRGSWSEAEEAARKACTELERFRIFDGIGHANYEIGEVRRRMGDLDAAEDSFSKAYENGHSAQPGMSLLLMDRGDLEGAAKSIGAALERRRGEAGTSFSRLSRAKLLPTQIEIALAREDVETANAALDELKGVAETFESSLWTAYALVCEGAIELHEGHPDQAIDFLNRSWLIWRDSDMPYEGARARTLLGMAHRAAGDELAANMELKAAASTFARLGAALDVQRLATLSGTEANESGPERRRVTRAFMFTDIVTSTDLIGIIGDAAWEKLLEWHDRELRKAITEFGGEVVSHTGDGFFAAFDNSRASIDAAVAIQRRLAEHREQHGFSPSVRIGLHNAEATRQGSDYRGQGVHAASRIGGLGGADEIVASSALVESAGPIPYAAGEVQRVELKGIAEAEWVRTIEWVP